MPKVLLLESEGLSRASIPPRVSDPLARARATRVELWCGLGLLGAFFLLLGAHLLAGQLPDGYLKDLFDLRVEANVPTWYGSVLCLGVALASAGCFFCERLGLARSGRTKKSSPVWLLICAAFLYASLDEVAQIHEHLLYLWRTIEQSVGRAPSARIVHWQVAYSPLLALMVFPAAAFLWGRFSRWPHLRLWLFASGACFAGAIALECVGCNPPLLWSLMQNPVIAKYRMLTLVEESLELIGVSFALLGVFGYLYRSVYSGIRSCMPAIDR